MDIPMRSDYIYGNYNQGFSNHLGFKIKQIDFRFSLYQNFAKIRMYY